MSAMRGLFVSDPKIDLMYKVEDLELRAIYSNLLHYEIFDGVDSSKIKITPLLKAIRNNFTEDELNSILENETRASIEWLVRHMIDATNVRKNVHSQVIYDALFFAANQRFMQKKDLNAYVDASALLTVINNSVEFLSLPRAEKKLRLNEVVVIAIESGFRKAIDTFSGVSSDLEEESESTGSYEFISDSSVDQSNLTPALRLASSTSSTASVTESVTMPSAKSSTASLTSSFASDTSPLASSTTSSTPSLASSTTSTVDTTESSTKSSTASLASSLASGTRSITSSTSSSQSSLSSAANSTSSSTISPTESSVSSLASSTSSSLSSSSSKFTNSPRSNSPVLCLFSRRVGDNHKREDNTIGLVSRSFVK